MIDRSGNLPTTERDLSGLKLATVTRMMRIWPMAINRTRE